MSRRTTMESLAYHVERKYNTLYFTKNPPNAGKDDDLYGYKYFLLFKNTFGIFRKYKTQEEAMEKFKKESDYISLPMNGDYVDGSFNLISNDVEEMEIMSGN